MRVKSYSSSHAAHLRWKPGEIFPNAGVVVEVVGEHLAVESQLVLDVVKHVWDARVCLAAPDAPAPCPAICAGRPVGTSAGSVLREPLAVIATRFAMHFTSLDPR